tara:strand:- start:384 stop:1283 length:900 start_codon:yes stop_codon:yes gene_type:complete
MIEIKLFGASTLAGEYFKNEYKKNLKNSKLVSFSRSNKLDVYFDLNSNSYPKELSLKDEALIISLAPIWLFVPFLKNYINKINIKKIKGILVISSTSVNTKRYSWNKFDKNLYMKLSYWERELIKLNKKYNLKITIIRPSLIYGDIGYEEDKNLSLIIKLMKKFVVIPIPKETGLRQPIHYSQLIKCILKISKSYLNLNSSIKSKSRLKIIDIGGDEELSYEKMLFKIKEHLLKESLLRRCFIIKIPNRIFFLILSPILIFSPKYYASILRISVNMGGFLQSYKIHKEKKNEFPLRIKK